MCVCFVQRRERFNDSYFVRVTNTDTYVDNRYNSDALINCVKPVALGTLNRKDCYYAFSVYYLSLYTEFGSIHYFTEIIIIKVYCMYRRL